MEKFMEQITTNTEYVMIGWYASTITDILPRLKAEACRNFYQP